MNNGSVSAVDSAAPLETSIHSLPEKVLASPLRLPSSPTRFSWSPQLNRIRSLHLDMTQVARVTRNFSSALKIGEGGFGTVYKAQLDSGQMVAIKRAKKVSKYAYLYFFLQHFPQPFSVLLVKFVLYRG